jgi:hypothetical protein
MKNERQHIRDLETLSAYLDGELTQADSLAVRARLQDDPGLKAQLENLRKTKTTVGSLPRLRAPHNFTLTPDMVTVRRSKKSAPFVGTLRLASALAAILLVVLFGVEFLFASGPLASTLRRAEPMMEAAMLAEDAEPEPLIVWGVPGAGGYGSDQPVNGIGGGDPKMEDTVMVESAPVEAEMPAEAEALPEEAPEMILEAEPLPSDAQEAEMLAPPPGAEKQLPILGINTDESGEIIRRSSDTAADALAAPAWRTIVRWLKVALGVVVVGGGLAWWLLRERGLG